MESREEGATSHEPRAANRAERGGAPAAVVPQLPDEVLAEIVRQAEAGYPEEICGIVIGRREEPATYTVRQVRNVANTEPQRDTTGVERNARTAYRMDDRDVLRVLREADAQGWDTLTFYHSHPDHDAYFSAMDRDRALHAEGEPLWPGACYLVISVRERRAREACAYLWDAAAHDFDEISIRLPCR